MYKIATKVLMIGKSLYFEKCETHKQLKERETFWQHKLKTSYPLGLKKNIYFNHTQNIGFLAFI